MAPETGFKMTEFTISLPATSANLGPAFDAAALAMNLALRFARANHEIIHARIGRLIGLRSLAFVGNPHNVASREEVTLSDGTRVEAIVHRKGATPAHAGTLGFIPGTMADPGFLTRGLGLPASLNSASHGAGRKLGRKKAIESIAKVDRDRYLTDRRVTLLGGGIDEAPQAYKDIVEVMAAQADLVTILGRFDPRIVRMADEEGGKRKGQLADGE